jgi:co-chaperonin GroES (HSP10)
MIAPTNNRLIVKLEEDKEEKTAGGLVLVKNEFRKPLKDGIIVAVGKEVLTTNENLTEGTRVKFDAGSGIAVDISEDLNSKYLIVRVGDIFTFEK